MAGDPTLQDLVTFEEVAIYFSAKEWETLTDGQKSLYLDVMKDNYEALVSLGLAAQPPSVLLQIEGWEKPCAGRAQFPKSRGESKDNFGAGGQPTIKQEPSLDEGDTGLPCCPSARKGTQEHGSLSEQPWWPGGSFTPDSTVNGAAVLSPWDAGSKWVNCSLVGEQARPVEFQAAPRGAEESSFWPLSVAAPQPASHEEMLLICTQCQKCFPVHSVLPTVVPHGALGQVCPECENGCVKSPLTTAESPSQTGVLPCSCAHCSMPGVRPRGVLKEERPYKCGKCDKTFRYAHEYSWHQKVHTGEKTYRCSDCAKVFRHKQELMWHQRTHTAEWPHKCGTCEKNFRFKQELTWHLKTHSVERPYKCPECEKSFRYKQEFMWHQRAHVGDRPYKCPACEKSFRFKQEFTWHQRSHAGEKTYRCPGCEKSFRYKQEFVWHQRIHTGEQPYPCASCSSTFTCRQEYMRHQRLHDGEKPYQCPHCEKTFRRGSTLIRHRRIHMGEGPFKCPHCQRAFGQSANLLKHQRTHSLKSERLEVASEWQPCLQSLGSPKLQDTMPSVLSLKTVSGSALLLLNLPDPNRGRDPGTKPDAWEPQM
ncbi:zinc finger protein 454-like isoform X1 [Pantherophis guttatus]|uniref:Zinc finger protein 454-like isoform X1 n=1 Tax=Pantherophis guttatus TaxID=94885 RepID=A0A6P9CMW1_PANGU|nr:zinc finger protein 454-like isoform X1 [Pantherophis guttatus]XP_034284574.1 zinc finger protein 454-like isoform X1 [Pantherophis guttatus]XP_034284575.1 zinc finger protein 454-like isoform X1 [Pantherophis guttatus]XP_034284576.1 zinc finger protein 454-like isoform X1 [Pantherophis guttatus]